MTSENERLLKNIKEEKTVNQISLDMNISNKKIFQRIKNLSVNGYSFSRQYYYNGDIKYILNKSFNDDDLTNRIIMDNEKNIFQALVVSDLHLGSCLERLDCLNLMYDYCIKNDIHIIVNAGDLINGMFGCPNNICSYEEQARYLLKNYPFDKNILNFVTLGNHDADSLFSSGLDLAKILYYNRHDIVPLGYASGKIDVKGESILIKHRIKSQQSNNSNLENDSSFLTLNGHLHKFSVSNTGNLNIYVPSLSDIVLENASNTIPSFLKLQITFSGHMASLVDVEQLIVSNNKISVIGDTTLYVSTKTKSENTKQSNKQSNSNPPRNKTLERVKNKYIGKH
ncbi:MAG: metallophosphoesterase [Clostridia bacterium]|jgi:hypothetical protein